MGQKGMTFLEYAILVSMIVVGVVFMSVYIQHSVQGRINESLEDMGGRYEYGGKTISMSVKRISRSVSTNVEELEAENIRKTTIDIPIDSKKTRSFDVLE